MLPTGVPPPHPPSRVTYYHILLSTQGGEHSLFLKSSLYYSSVGLRWEGFKSSRSSGLGDKKAQDIKEPRS